MCDFGVVRDEDDGASRGVQLLEEHQHLETRPRVEVPRRLVGQNDRRIVYQCAGDGHALHLSARHLVAAVQQPVAESDGFERGHGTVAPFGRRTGGVVHQRQFDVLDGRRLGQQVVVLEDETDLAVAQRGALVLVHRTHRRTVEVIFACGGGVEAAERVEQRRLARSGGPQDREGDAAQCMYRLVSHPEIAPDVVQPDDLFHGFISSFCRRPEGQA